MRLATGLFILMPTLLALAAPLAHGQGPARTVVAIFAHPDDERLAGPLLARYAREGHRVHVVVATDGSKGIAPHAGIPPGDSLARTRAAEMHCAARALGVMPPILLGLEDGGLANYVALGRLRAELRNTFERLRPDAIITFGPEGGTGHPDHRLVGVVVTEIVQKGGEGIPDALYYPGIPAERMADAPAASPAMNAMASKHLTVRVTFEPVDFDAAHRAYACHASQYMRQQVDANMAYLKHALGGIAYLRRWNDGSARATLF